MKKAIYLDFVTCRYKMISLPFEKLSANSISNIFKLGQVLEPLTNIEVCDRLFLSTDHFVSYA